MGKKYDAERVRKFIDNLHSQLDTYDSGARIVESNYKRYIGNDKYLGVAADASKQYVSVKQMMFHKEQDTIHDKIYRLYCDIETTFIDTVDSSPKARIDTDELGIIKTDHTGYYKALDKEGYGVEDKVREIQSALEGYWSFTQPDYNPARQSYIKFCGNGKFLDDCVKKVEQFDQDSWDYVNRSGLEEYVYELTDDIKQTASALNATRVYDPQMDDVFLGLVTHGGKYVKDFLLHKDTVDEFLYTGDQKLDAIINAFMVFDATTGRYVYEDKMRDWKNLSPDERTVVSHLYDCYSTQYGTDYSDDSIVAAKSRGHLERILSCCVSAKNSNSYIGNEDCSALAFTDFGEYLYSITGEDSYSHNLLQGLKDMKNITGMPLYSETGNVSISLMRERYATVIYCNTDAYNNPDSDLVLINYHSSFVTSKESTLSYIEENIKNDPKCYDHLKELGFDNESFVSILNAAENKDDATILDNLTKTDGDYSKVFMRNAGLLSDSAKEAIFTYTASLQSIYATLAEEKNNLVQTEQYKNTPEQYRDKCYGALDDKIELYKNELESLSAFYADSDNAYSNGYYESYMDITKTYLTPEEKVALYVSPGYKMSDEEVVEAKALYKEQLDSFQYRGSGHPLFKNPGDEERYKNAVILKHKCSAAGSAASAAVKTIFDLGAVSADITVAAANSMSVGIDSITGANTQSAMAKFNEGYHELGDYIMSGVNEDAHSSATQHPYAYALGSLGTKYLIYQAATPVFSAVAKSLGIKSAVGKFIFGQLTQDTMDVMLYTYPKYKELTADGEFSTGDKIAVAIDIAVNSGLNLVFEGFNIGLDKVSSKKLVDQFRAADDIDEFCKGLKEKDIKRLINNLNSGEKEVVLKSISGSAAKAKAIEGAADVVKAADDIKPYTIDDFKREMEELPHPTIDESTREDIINLGNGNRWDPSDYMSKDDIAKHLEMFDDGCVKFQSKEVYESNLKAYGPGIGSPKDGTFVTPKNVAEKAIEVADGDPRKLEELLGLQKGELGDNPLLIEFTDPKNLRMPTGNGVGANEFWEPGGFTAGDIPEAMVDQAREGEFIISEVFK